MPQLTNTRQPPDFSQLETEVLKFWRSSRAFERQVEMRPADKPFVFYDGPPFATGMPHYGHLLASTTKDVVPRYWSMKGYRVERLWGWDCHGLPIETMIEGQLGIKGKRQIEKYGIAEFNQACQREVMRLDSEWEKIISRLGRWVNFAHNYKTMDLPYMESVWWGFRQLYDKGLIYQGKHVIMYSPSSGTPLSKFEVAMDNSYQQVTETATIYKYRLKGQPDTYLLAWSTTPWTKLATPALAVNAALEYAQVRQGNEYLILAASRLGELTDQPYEVVKTVRGSDLTKLEFELQYDFYPDRTPQQKAGVIVADDFVSDEEGTGIVTLAVYGEDDYRVMKKHGIQLIEHLDDEGRFKPEVTPWAGKSYLEASPSIDDDLRGRGLVYVQRDHSHQVPLDYRTGERVYFAPVPALFVNVNQLKQQLIEANESINWIPAHLKHGRFLKGIENAPDWNISRSRFWGTPIPIWQSQDGQQRRVIGSLSELKDWAVKPEVVDSLTDLHRQYLDEVEVWVDDERTVVGTRVPEVLDCWVESGSMPFASKHYPFENKAAFETAYPAQFISEYIPQTRAWFYCMHLISVGIFGRPAFENALTTGTILAEDGSKMSKSKQNFPDATVVMNKYGADTLRLYLMSSPLMKGESLNFSEKELADINRQVLIIWWNVTRFYLSFADRSHRVSEPPAEIAATSRGNAEVMDRWLVARLEALTAEVTAYFDDYDLARASRVLMAAVDELSTWYLRLSRHRLKAKGNATASHTLGWGLYRLAQLMAPLTPFFSEVVHQQLVDGDSSVHHTDWPAANRQPSDEQLLAEMELVKRIVEIGRAARQAQGVKLRQPLSQARVTSPAGTTQPADELLALISQELNVKKVVWEQAGDATKEPSIEFEWQLTAELKAEGEARELTRQIQSLRRRAGLTASQHVTVTAPNWPASHTASIESAANVSLVRGSELGIRSTPSTQ
ncbi:MAG: isoleucine--tRNA ligase [Candidatus Pacebacteria bacterium CG10_big_fil_rev_8_21_14_0_10_56_10]|nr:MAG: isoleucine--tRNA ligase [Candidatus Pacebacteria bacterium CG10_big_fil_rev_8_21_14_0_10_56_10]